jgi:enoyl-CoA hydratase/carnithine racemase
MENMLDYEFMRLEKEGKLAWLTFTRENHLNAMNNACIDQINRIAMALREDPDVRVVVIRGEGKAFSTGIDLKELAADRIEMDYHRRWEQALRLFETMEKLVIVGMHGYCLGGALQLALAADIRVSTAECKIGLPAIKESLIPGLATLRLPRYIGWGRAKKMILGGQNIDGQEALRIGLVDHIALEEDFFSHLDEIADDYLAACSVGTRMSKLVTNRAFDLDYETILQYYFELQQRAQFSPDAAEAKRAYLAKRKPSWQ